MNRRHPGRALAALFAAVACLSTHHGLPGAPAPSGDAARRSAAEGLGYAAALQAELARIGQISPEEFARSHAAKAKLLLRIDWDPTTALYWDRFNLDPNKPGQTIRLRGAEEREFRERARDQRRPVPDDKPVTVPLAGGPDFRLDPNELALFKRNGFVVSERLGAPSCTEMFYRIYKRDLPVFVTTDAVLHAWHRSFDAILEEVETTMLMPALAEVLDAMAGKVREAGNDYGKGLFTDSLADADFFLAVARSLLKGKQVPDALGQRDRVAKTLAACARLGLEKLDLFGVPRDVDFSQFKPRGHYEKSQALRRYFQAMIWCGRIDLRVAGEGGLATRRQLAGAIVLHDLLRRSGQFGRWQQFDSMLRTFAGSADSMTFAQLGAVLAAAGIRSPAGVKDDAALDALQRQILAGKVGAQEIRGDVFTVDPFNSERFVLPRSFTFLGQRFAIDSWVLSEVVFDSVLWDRKKVMRRVPSALDVAFAALGNDHAVGILRERMTDAAGRKFRDGLNYQHNLAAARAVVDRQTEEAWSDNLYSGWLACLRELSRPTAEAKYPQAMRTPAWSMKSLSTQLASWAQLRHDTGLYVKQSYGAGFMCHYPAGFVEPVPHFWARLGRMAAQAAKLIEQTPYPDRKVQQKQAGFLRRFAATTATLRAIAEKELAQQELTREETKFLQDVIETTHVKFGSGRRRAYAGWYPGLFYAGADDSEKWDALVADVHTNPPAPDVGDPGCVLHMGVGAIDLLVVAVDNGKDRMVYAGPVLSCYEIEMPGVSRKTDAEWKKDLREGRAPPRPAWTRGYLVPGTNKEMKGYRD
jgi:hypothetical protein